MSPLFASPVLPLSLALLFPAGFLEVNTMVAGTRMNFVEYAVAKKHLEKFIHRRSKTTSQEV